MKKLVTILALAAILALPLAAHAEDWFEATVQFSEKVDGKLSPGMSIQGVNYINNMGLGWLVGEGDAFGPVAFWRVFDHRWEPKGWGMSMTLGTNSDIGLPGSEIEKPTNVAYIVQPRAIYTKFNDLVELGGLIQYTTMEGMEPDWTFGLILTFRPSGFSGGQ